MSLHSWDGHLPESFEETIERLRERVFPLARLLHALAQTVKPPILVTRVSDRGFRYDEPGLVHFCLLRGVRIVSGLNASIELARSGYAQEIAALLRTVIEYSTQIDFMLASFQENGTLSDDASEFLVGFFEDSLRGSEQQAKKKAKLIQKKVHNKIAARLDAFASKEHSREQRKPTSQLFSNVYAIFSNYVHGRYPETMDLYGGIHGRFHMSGMRRTPKDNENVEVLRTMIQSASNCFVGMVQDLDLRTIVAADPVLEKWFREEVNRPRG